MDVYVFFSLLGLGYLGSKSSSSNVKKRIFSEKTSDTQDSSSPQLDHYKNGFDGNIYDSRITEKIKSVEAKKAHALHKKSLMPGESKVISSNYRDTVSAHGKEKPFFESKLSGENILLKEFTHNNMEPFFGGTVKQNVNTEKNESILEQHTGRGGIHDIQKQENVCFADVAHNSGKNANGQQGSYEMEYKRMQKSKMQTNDLPFTKQYVAPGLNDGYTNRSNQKGFHSDNREYVIPKNVDELRVKTNQKQTYAGKLIDGQKGTRRGLTGNVSKNKVDTFFEQTPDMYLKTTGEYKKDKYRPTIIVKDTNRASQNTNHFGNLYKNIGNEQSSKLQPTKKTLLKEFGVRNYDNENKGNPEFDYGKQNILVYNNERTVTGTRTHEGNLTSLVKSIIAPLQDVMRSTTKQHTTINYKREFGEMQTTMPSKPTIYDPNDIAKTTIKETTLHDAQFSNLRSAQQTKSTADPQDVMKTTVKETTLHETRASNVNGGKYISTVYDPDDIAKTTIKETTLHETKASNLKGGKIGATVYDPNDIAKTTIKETFIHDTRLGNFKRDQPNSIVYDPDDVMKTTVKETLPNYENVVNLRHVTTKATVYDPNDKLRTTIRETTEDNDHDGNIGNVEGGGGYETNKFNAPNTQKQFTSDNEYMGTGPNLENANGYINADIKIDPISKQFISDNEHYGNANSTDRKQMSYDDIYNAQMNEVKEMLSRRRNPTQTSVKIVSGSETVNMETNKAECANVSTRAMNNVQTIYNMPVSTDSIHLTREKININNETCDSRIDPDILKAFMENPYTKPLNEAV
jgi:hypothetical protein